MAEIPEGFVDISPKSDRGVLKKIIKEGDVDQKPQFGHEVEVHYVGTLYGGEKDGEKFDSSRDRNEKFKFKLGKGEVIRAWDTGVATMKKGEVCELICAPAFAYADKGSGDKIPPNSTLKFEVELFDWKGEDISPARDESIIMTLTEKSESYAIPKDCCKVTIALRGLHEGRVFEEREVTFEMGDGPSHDVVFGVEEALKKMHKDDKAIVEIKPQHAFGIRGKPEAGVPPGATVHYEVHLKHLEKVKESWELSDNQEKLSYAEEMKVKGTEHFKANKWKMAISFYEKSRSFISYESDFKEEAEQKHRHDILVAIHLNLALCQLKLEEAAKCIQECEKALELQPKSDKAYFRIGQAHFLTGDYDEAKKAFGKALEIDGSNKSAQHQIALCIQKIREAKEQEKKLCQTIFSKLLPQPSKDPKPAAPTPASHETPAAGGESQLVNGSGESPVDAPPAAATPMEA